MQKKQFSFNKTTWLWLPLIAIFSMAVISSCKCKKKPQYPSCVQLTKAQIQKWVDKGYTDSTKADYMIALQIKTAYAFPGTVFRYFICMVRSY